MTFNASTHLCLATVKLHHGTALPASDMALCTKGRNMPALSNRSAPCTDAVARAALYARANAMMQADPPWLTLYNPVRVTGIAGQHPGFVLGAGALLDVSRLPKVAYG